MAENATIRGVAGTHPAPPRHIAVDGLVVGGKEVWVLVAGPDDDVADLLWPDDGHESLRICKAVLDDDVLLLGDADPDQDPLLSDILRGDHFDNPQ